MLFFLACVRSAWELRSCEWVFGCISKAFSGAVFLQKFTSYWQECGPCAKKKMGLSNRSLLGRMFLVKAWRWRSRGMGNRRGTHIWESTFGTHIIFLMSWEDS